MRNGEHGRTEAGEGALLEPVVRHREGSDGEEGGVEGDDGIGTLRLYLRHLREYPLLSPAEEVALSRRVEESRRKVIQGLFSLPRALQRLIDLAEEVRRGNLRVEQVVRSSGGDRQGGAGGRRRFLLRMSRIRRLFEDRGERGNGKRGSARDRSGTRQVVSQRPLPACEAGEVLLREVWRLNLRDDVVDTLADEFLGELGVPATAAGAQGDDISSRVPRRVMKSLSAVLEGRKELDEAKSALIEANLRLVVSVARRYAGLGVGLCDLIQEGNIGLIRAAEGFNHRRGCRFSTYATWWIRQSVVKAAHCQSRTVRLPMHVVNSVAKISRMTTEFRREGILRPSLEEIADRASMSARRVRGVFESQRETVSLESPIGEDGGQLKDMIVDTHAVSPLDALVDRCQPVDIEALVDALQPREATVIRRRYGLSGEACANYEELAREFGVTRERVRQIASRAIGRLQSMLNVEPRRRRDGWNEWACRC